MFSEQLNVEGELTQTYPYYSPTCYYSTPMPSYQMGQPQVRDTDLDFKVSSVVSVKKSMKLHYGFECHDIEMQIRH